MIINSAKGVRMSPNEITQEILQVHQRVNSLLRRADMTRMPSEGFASEILPALRQAEEVLDEAETVLRRQDQELSAARDALTSEQQRYRELFELTTDGYVRTDLEGNVREANRAATTLLQRNREEVTGKQLLDVI